MDLSWFGRCLAWFDLSVDGLQHVGADDSEVGVGFRYGVFHLEAGVFGDSEAEAGEPVERVELDRAVGAWNGEPDRQVGALDDLCALVDASAQDRNPYECDNQCVLHGMAPIS